MKPAGALILAAGMSRRMGSFKPLMEFQGETLIGRVVRSLREAGASCWQAVPITSTRKSTTASRR